MDRQTVRLARRSALLCAHNLLLIGPPGNRQDDIGARPPTILPPLSAIEAIEVTRLYRARAA